MTRTAEGSSKCHSERDAKSAETVSIHVAKVPKMFEDIVVLKGLYTAFPVLTEVVNVLPTPGGNPRFRDPFDGWIAFVDNLRASSGRKQRVKLQI